MGLAKMYVQISYIFLVVLLLQESYGQENDTFVTRKYKNVSLIIINCLIKMSL